MARAEWATSRPTNIKQAQNMSRRQSIADAGRPTFYQKSSAFMAHNPRDNVRPGHNTVIAGKERPISRMGLKDLKTNGIRKQEVAMSPKTKEALRSFLNGSDVGGLGRYHSAQSRPVSRQSQPSEDLPRRHSSYVSPAPPTPTWREDQEDNARVLPYIASSSPTESGSSSIASLSSDSETEEGTRTTAYTETVSDIDSDEDEYELSDQVGPLSSKGSSGRSSPRSETESLPPISARSSSTRPGSVLSIQESLVTARRQRRASLAVGEDLSARLRLSFPSDQGDAKAAEPRVKFAQRKRHSETDITTNVTLVGGKFVQKSSISASPSRSSTPAFAEAVTKAMAVKAAGKKFAKSLRRSITYHTTEEFRKQISSEMKASAREKTAEVKEIGSVIHRYTKDTERRTPSVQHEVPAVEVEEPDVPHQIAHRASEISIPSALKVERKKEKKAKRLSRIRKAAKAGQKMTSIGHQFSDHLQDILRERERRAQAERERKSNECTALTWGRGIEGQLGDGDHRNQMVPVLVELDNKPVSDLRCGVVASAAITASGELYTWGTNTNGQLGLRVPTPQHTPKLIESLASKKVVDVALGDSHAAAVTEDGELYTWGLGLGSRLGHGDDRNQATPKLVAALKGHHVLHVACGEEHTLCLTDNGEIYAWGRNDEGQLGLGHNDEQATPTKVPKVIRVAAIAAAGFHSACVTYNGDLFTWGWNAYGQLGVGDLSDRSLPTHVTKFDGNSVTKVSCGAYHMAATTPTQQLFLWGYLNRREQPELVRRFLGDLQVKDVSCGEKFVGVVTAQGKVYQLGFPRDASVNTDWEEVCGLNNLPVVAVSCGAKHMGVLVSGVSNHSKLNREEKQKIREERQLQNAKARRQSSPDAFFSRSINIVKSEGFSDGFAQTASKVFSFEKHPSMQDLIMSYIQSPITPNSEHLDSPTGSNPTIPASLRALERLG